MTNFETREYQEESVKAIFDDWYNNITAVIAVMCVSAGKTVVSGQVMKRILDDEPTARILYLAHEEQLLIQPMEDMESFFPNLAKLAGIVQGKRNSVASRIVLASVPTIRNADRFEEVLQYGRFTHVIIDECHHVMSPSYMSILERVERDGPFYHLGLTGTPIRGDEKELQVYQKVSVEIHMRELVEMGYLVPPVFHSLISTIDPNVISEQHKTANLGYTGLERFAIANECQRDLMQLMRKEWEERKQPLTLFAMPTAEMAEIFAEWMQEQGHDIKYITTNNAKDKRLIIQMARDEEIGGIAFFRTMEEGVNIKPARLLLIGRYFPSKSTSKYIQIVGRLVRKWDKIHPMFGKKEHADIVDFFFDEDRPLAQYGVSVGGGLGTFTIDTIEKNIREAMTEEEKQIYEAKLREVHARKISSYLNADNSRLPRATLTQATDLVNKSPFRWVDVDGVSFLAAGTGNDGWNRLYIIQNHTADEYRLIGVAKRQLGAAQIGYGERGTKWYTEDPTPLQLTTANEMRIQGAERMSRGKLSARIKEKSSVRKVIATSPSKNLLAIQGDKGAYKFAPEGSNPMTLNNGSWMSRSPSGEQVKLAEKLGINIAGNNKGQVSDKINAHYVLGVLKQVETEVDGK